MDASKTSLVHGTLGGTLLELLHNNTTNPFLETAIMSAIGAAMSFIVSWSLKEMIGWVRSFLRRRKPQ